MLQTGQGMLIYASFIIYKINITITLQNIPQLNRRMSYIKLDMEMCSSDMLSRYKSVTLSILVKVLLKCLDLCSPRNTGKYNIIDWKAGGPFSFCHVLTCQ